MLNTEVVDRLGTREETRVKDLLAAMLNTEVVDRLGTMEETRV